MLDNFLGALKIIGALSSLKRVILVTSAKQYSVHLGAPKNPMRESEPWLIASHRPQISTTASRTSCIFCARHSISWVVTYPNDVIGFAEGNFMNLGTALGLYAAVTKEFGTELVFPGSERFSVDFDSFTCSKLHARFCVWVALEPRAAGQSVQCCEWRRRELADAVAEAGEALRAAR